MFSDIVLWQWLIMVVCAILIGINKTGIPGIGPLPVVLLALSFPAAKSTGIQLIMLCMADLMAVTYYRKKANWNIILKLIPFALCGIALGSFVMRFFDDSSLRIAIGIIILAMAGLNVVRRKFLKPDMIPSHWIFSLLIGLAAGFSTQVANAAGPVMAIYLLSMQLPKEEYLGTGAWYFMILNFLKLPVFIWEGRIVLESLYIDLCMLPAIILGAFLGVVIAKKISQQSFELIVQILIVISAIKLLF